MARRASSGGEPLFGPDFLTILERLDLIARQVLHGRRQALRPSSRKGSSVEFKDFREYSPGDDPRTIDWMVYGRLGELYVRLFRQEEELDLWVLLDRSASMNFGEPGTSKFDHARRIAAALTYIGMANMDSASLIPFDTETRPGLQRMRGKGQIFRVMSTLESLEPASRTDFVRAVQMFTSGAAARRPGMVVVLSDFYGLQAARTALDRLRFFKHQIHVIQLVCPWELDPPLRGELRLVDTESGAHQDLTITDSLLRRYKTAFEAFSADLRRYAMTHSVGFDRATTQTSFDEFVRGLLQRAGPGGLLA
jgi:uncharacterized protein (DUF58 family)